MTALTLRTPSDYLLTRDVCSYGYFLLPPNVWDPGTRTLTRPLDLDGGVATLTIAQPGDRSGATLRARADRPLSRAEQAHAKRLLRRMLQLDDDTVAEFHRLDPRWKRSGRGRLFRSPTFFEDVIKTVTSCNVQWPSTVTMNRRLCEVINPAFPRPTQLARRRPSTLRARCRVGYRDTRIVELARRFARGDVDAAWFENPANDDETVFKALTALPGIGPYAAANIMQLINRYSRLAIDTETYRHAKTTLGMRGTDGQLHRRVVAHYDRFADQKFRSYWFELLENYESRNGPAWTWSPRMPESSFTASQLRKPARAAMPRRAQPPKSDPARR